MFCAPRKATYLSTRAPQQVGSSGAAAQKSNRASNVPQHSSTHSMLAVRGQEHPGNERRLAGSSSAQNLSRVGRAEMAAPPQEVPDFDTELQDYLRGLDLLNKVDCVSPLALTTPNFVPKFRMRTHPRQTCVLSYPRNDRCVITQEVTAMLSVLEIVIESQQFPVPSSRSEDYDEALRVFRAASQERGRHEICKRARTGGAT